MCCLCVYVYFCINTTFDRHCVKAQNKYVKYSKSLNLFFFSSRRIKISCEK